MLLKPRIIVDDKIVYTRIPYYLGKGKCGKCKYNSMENDCRHVMLKGGAMLKTYCYNSIMHRVRWWERNWDYVITEER